MALGEMTDAMGDGVEANHTGATVFAADHLRRDFRSSLKLRRDESAWQAQPPLHLRLQRVGLAPRRKKGFLNFYFFLHTSVLTCLLADVSFLSPAKASVWLRFLRQRSDHC